MREKFTSLTVKEIKDYERTNKISVPSSFRKSERIDYILRVEKERSMGIVATTFSSLDIYDKIMRPEKEYFFERIEASGGWIKHLDTYGWSVVKIPDFSPEDSVDEFYTFLESLGHWENDEWRETSFNRNDGTTWKRTSIAPSINGIFKRFIGHEEFLWNIREKCHPIFSEIFEEDDLVSSFDGACFLYNVRGSSFSKSSPKIHVDQPRWYKKRGVVQGVVNLIDSGPNDGGLIILDDVNAFFRYIRDRPSACLFWEGADISHPVFDSLRGNNQEGERMFIKISVPAGYIMLFDSVIFHGIDIPTRKDSIRMVTYVSQVPKRFLTYEENRKRIEWYEQGKMTGHWCYGRWLSNTDGFTHRTNGYNVPREIKKGNSNVSQLRRSLVGYD